MARPNVKFLINDESFVIPSTEEFSTTAGAVFNASDALSFLGTTAERDAGYMYIQDLSSWFGKLSSYIVKEAGGAAAFAGITLYSIGSCAASYIDGTYAGVDAQFKNEWWPIHNFLQYGGPCYVGFETASLATYTDEFANLPFDVIFQGGTTGSARTNYETPVISIVDSRTENDNPVIGVLYVKSDPDTSNSVTANKPSGANTENFVFVYGEKVHLDGTGNSTSTVITSLAPDVAGCICRTDRDSFPWFSPAGTRRGRILNVLRLNRTLSNTEQDTLYDAEINPVVTFPGDGTILYGDKTGLNDASTLSRINVSRLFMYIRKSLAPVARSLLFEQNDAITRGRFKTAAEGFLERIVAQRGIQDFRVICDESNNTPEIIEGNLFVAELLIKPITSINYIKITLTNKDLSSTL